MHSGLNQVTPSPPHNFVHKFAPSPSSDTDLDAKLKEAHPYSTNSMGQIMDYPEKKPLA